MWKSFSLSELGAVREDGHFIWFQGLLIVRSKRWWLVSSTSWSSWFHTLSRWLKLRIFKPAYLVVFRCSSWRERQRWIVISRRIMDSTGSFIYLRLVFVSSAWRPTSCRSPAVFGYSGIETKLWVDLEPVASITIAYGTILPASDSNLGTFRRDFVGERSCQILISCPWF